MTASAIMSARPAGPGVRPRDARAARPAPRRPLMILLTGPGPVHEAALALFEAGHVPIVGTDIAAPLAATRGARSGPGPGPGPAERGPGGDGITGPLATRLLVMCDALVRVGGAADDADMLVRMAEWEGKPVYYRIADVLAVG